MKSGIVWYTRWVKWDVVLRLIFGPFIFVSPIIATVVNLILDGFDGEIFKRSGYARPQYSIYDKVLDYWWYIWIFIFVLISDVPAKQLFIFLFIYRTIGQILFLIFRKGIILFIFPNIFELVFFYYLFAKFFGLELTLMNGVNLIRATVVLSILGFSREVIIHLKQMNFSGVYLGKITYWPIRTVNPYKAFIFMSLALSFSFVMSQYMYIRTTETYSARAQKAQRGGTIISYDPSGMISGTYFSQIDPANVHILDLTNSKGRLFCTISNMPTLKTTLTGLVVKDVYVFEYTDACLRSLPDGKYGILAPLLSKDKSEVFIGFEIYRSMLRK